MLFSPCAQDTAALFLPGASSLCTGGVGFVTAMMATLATNARTAPARTLGQAIPGVDRLAVRMVTDNIVIQFVQSEMREGIHIERRARANLAPDRRPRGVARHSPRWLMMRTFTLPV